MNRYICIHGHFYQPPRENAWLEEVELQDSAYPYHDWNERITAECYAPNAASRILDDEQRIIQIGNNYSRISFNFGPTLLSWLERHSPEVHDALIEADVASREYFSGHGSAMAQVYNHMIMPLANTRDKRTQVKWGVKDFGHRFGRAPEGMWLAETAADLETLDILAEHGILFTILAPRQASRVRSFGRRWRDVSSERINPRHAYLCKLPSGRTISIFFYDGPISQDLAFGGLLNSGEALAGRLVGAFPAGDDGPQLVDIASDGETYGHHHRFGEMALAYCLHHIEANNLAKLTVYGEYLEKFPPRFEVEIVENSSWSCVHGIERWRSNCGCNTGRGWSQEWRQPLRDALDWLRDSLAPIYENEMGSIVPDPWQTRDEYINIVLNPGPSNIELFLAQHGAGDLSPEQRNKALGLLEMQRHAMLMYTSCGWFFDEPSGLETTQVLRYAARAIQLAEECSGVDLEGFFVDLLSKAPSNIAEYGNGAVIYDKFVRPAMVDLLRVGAHYAISSLFEDYHEVETVYCYTIEREVYERAEAGRQKLAIGRARLRSNVTLAESTLSFAVVHLGDHNLMGGVRRFHGQPEFDLMRSEIQKAFRRSDVPGLIHGLDKHFETHNYSLWHLFKDEQRTVFARILQSTLQEVESSFRSIYEHHYPIMQVIRETGNPIPKALATTAEFIINADMRKALEADQLNLGLLKTLVDAIDKWSFEVDKTIISFLATRSLTALMKQLDDSPEDLTLLETIDGALAVLERLPLTLDLWKAQNIHFSISKKFYGIKRDQAEGGDEDAGQWIERFDKLGTRLEVRSI
jgi:alpha-amylase/alpha-mannosidase (GH57 family)